MKLSEAISLGAMLTPQAIGHFVDTNGGHCAWASASEAVGGTTTSIMHDEWKWTKRMTFTGDFTRRLRLWRRVAGVIAMLRQLPYWRASASCRLERQQRLFASRQFTKSVTLDVCWVYSFGTRVAARPACTP